MGTKRKFFSFCFAGIMGATLELLAFNLFFLFLNFSSSKIISLIFGLSLNFIINRNITFLAKSGKIKKQFAKYVTVYTIAIAINFTVSLAMNSFLGPGTLNANIATATGIISSIPITFLGSLHWVFKDKIPTD